MTDIADMVTKFTDEAAGKIEGATTEAREAKAMALELMQKLATGGRGGDSHGGETWGSEFISAKSGDLRAIEGQRGSIAMEVKATLSSTTAAGLIVPDRDTMAGLPARRLMVRNLLTVVNTTSGSVEYPRMTGRPDGAAPVAEGDLKPESAMTFDLESVPIRTIAHWIPASVQILADAPQLQGLIDSELTYGVALAEETQLLYGSGTGANVLGLVPQATAFADPLTLVTPNEIDTLGSAILQASLTEIAPDGIVVHPSDFMRMRLTKDADGKYIMGAPGDAVEPRLFGYPVVTTQAMTVGNFLVGSFKSQTLYDRQRTTIDVSTEHSDFFVRNLCAVRAENRIGLAAKQPGGLIYGSFA